MNCCKDSASHCNTIEVGVARQQHMITVQWFHVVTRVTTIQLREFVYNSLNSICWFAHTGWHKCTKLLHTQQEPHNVVTNSPEYNPNLDYSVAIVYIVLLPGSILPSRWNKQGCSLGKKKNWIYLSIDTIIRIVAIASYSPCCVRKAKRHNTIQNHSRYITLCYTHARAHTTPHTHSPHTHTYTHTCTHTYTRTHTHTYTHIPQKQPSLQKYDKVREVQLDSQKSQ